MNIQILRASLSSPLKGWVVNSNRALSHGYLQARTNAAVVANNSTRNSNLIGFSGNRKHVLPKTSVFNTQLITPSNYKIFNCVPYITTANKLELNAFCIRICIGYLFYIYMLLETRLFIILRIKLGDMRN